LWPRAATPEGLLDRLLSAGRRTHDHGHTDSVDDPVGKDEAKAQHGVTWANDRKFHQFYPRMIERARAAMQFRPEKLG
jgi:hypothetical protein